MSGAKLRDFHLARALGECSQLTYVYYADPDSPPLTTREFPFCREVIAVPKPKAYTVARLMAGLTSPLPLTVLNYFSEKMSRSLGSLLSANSFDIIHLDATQLAAYVPLLEARAPRSQIVFDWHNIESELLQRYAETAKSAPRRFYAHRTEQRMAALESKLLHSQAGHIICSAREATQLKSLAPEARLAVIENGVDAAAFDGVAASPNETPNRIVFVGLMAYHANVDAAVWFTTQIWPQLRARFPGFTLTIVGASPAPAVLALASEPHVEVTGTVPDVRSYYAEAFAVVVPLRTGAGTRLKILEAMAACVPVIATRLGTEGLAATPGKDLLIAQRPEDWLAALESLQRPEVRSGLTTSARSLVESRYDWTIIGQTLRQTYESWLR
jgi:sugar transferase (PEP-CTERM/EpsH1 system associated)